MSLRKSAVSGSFYPSNPLEIKKMFDSYNKILDKNSVKLKDMLSLKSRVLIVPHAGYVYSGFSANFGYRVLSNNSDIKRVVVIGPSHRVYINGSSISEHDSFETPFGDIEIDRKLVGELKNLFNISFSPQAHSEHSTEVQAPFIKYYLPNASIVEIVYGEQDPKELSKIIDYLLKDENTAIVISTDLSHFYDLDSANQIDAICLNAIENIDLNKLDGGCEACGKIGVKAMLLSALDNSLKPVLLDYRTSADASGDKDRVVGYLSAAFVSKEVDKKDILLSLARASIKDALGLEYKYDLQDVLKKYKWLDEKGASFVTLNKSNGDLRGCIGSIVAHRKLYEDIIHNARASALNDTRFKPLTKEEFDDISVEVSILTEPKKVEYNNMEELKKKISMGIDGVILKDGNYQATFLPQVWDQLPTFDLFFSHLCQKARLGESCIKNKPEIFIYQVEKYK